jgi:hypothetical protein
LSFWDATGKWKNERSIGEIMPKKNRNNGRPRAGYEDSGKVQADNNVLGGHHLVTDQGATIVPLFQTLTYYIDSHPKLQPGKKQDAKEQLKKIQTALEEPNPDENIIMRYLRNLKRMSPHVVDLFFDTFKNMEVINRVAKKMAE